MEVNEIEDYRKNKTIELIEKYKDLILKTFIVADKDLLQGKIEEDANETQTEQAYLDAIKKRRVALDEVDLMLDKIEKLEQQINPKSEDEKDREGMKRNWTKEKAANK